MRINKIAAIITGLLAAAIGLGMLVISFFLTWAIPDPSQMKWIFLDIGIAFFLLGILSVMQIK